MATKVTNHTKGAGTIYFNDGTGERAIRCSDKFALEIETETLARYCMDSAIKTKVREIPIQVNYKCSFDTSDISAENLAMTFLGVSSTITTAAIVAPAGTETITGVKVGRFYQIGTTAVNKVGYRNINTLVVKVGAATKVLGTDYAVDLALGRIEILGAGIIDGDDIILTYGVGASTRTQVISSSNVVKGSLRYIADNTSGENNDIYLPQVTLSPSGSYELKSDNWQMLTFDVAIEQPDGGAAVYIDGRAA